MRKDFIVVLFIVILLGSLFLLLRGCVLPVAPPLEGEDFTNWSTVEGRVTKTHYSGPLERHPAFMTIYYEYSVEGVNYKFETFYYFFEDDEYNQEL